MVFLTSPCVCPFVPVSLSRPFFRGITITMYTSQSVICICTNLICLSLETYTHMGDGRETLDSGRERGRHLGDFEVKLRKQSTSPSGFLVEVDTVTLEELSQENRETGVIV